MLSAALISSANFLGWAKCTEDNTAGFPRYALRVGKESDDGRRACRPKNPASLDSWIGQHFMTGPVSSRVSLLT
jgi:hypothetical protein